MKNWDPKHDYIFNALYNTNLNSKVKRVWSYVTDRSSKFSKPLNAPALLYFYFGLIMRLNPIIYATSENKIKEESKVLMMRSFILSHLDLNAIDKYDETPLIVQKIEDIAGDGESDKLGIFWAISDLVCSQIDEELISFSDIFSSKGLIDRSEDLKEAAEMIYELNKFNWDTIGYSLEEKINPSN